MVIPTATALMIQVGAEGMHELQGQTWFHEATEEEARSFWEAVWAKHPDAPRERGYTDRPGRPYWLVVLHDDAPEKAKANARRYSRCVHLLD